MHARPPEKPGDPPPGESGRAARLGAFVSRARDRVARWVPPGFRWLVGLLLIIGGFLGFLPIVGFWMIPLGVAVAAMDLGWLRNLCKSRR